jgi:hypothetical protein
MSRESTTIGAGPGESKFAGRTAIALLAALNAAVLALAVRSAWHPYPFEPGDGGTLSSAWHIVARGPIYNEIGGMPYVFNIHNPVFIHLSALMMYLFGPRPEGPRLLAVAMLAGAAAFVFLTVKRATGSTAAALVAGLLLPAERAIAKRTGLAVCDFSALFFSMLGLYLLQTRKNWPLAAAAFALGYFSKQSAIAAPIAGIAALLFERRGRQALVVSSLWLACLGAGFLIAWRVWGKAFFLNTLAYGTVTSFSPLAGLVSIGGFVAAYPLLTLAIGMNAWRAVKERRGTVVPFYVAGGLVVAYLSGNEGSSVAYFFDLEAGAALSAGLMWPEVSRRLCAQAAPNGGLLRWAVAGQLALTAAAAFYGNDSLWTRGNHDRYDEVRASLYQAADAVVLYQIPGCELGRSSMNFSTDPHRLAQMLKAGVVARAQMLRLVKERAFTAVIMPVDNDAHGLFDEALREAVKENYVVLEASPKEEYYVVPPKTALRADAPASGARAGTPEVEQ